MKKALCIGINDYAATPLYGCMNDARAVAELLEINEDDTINFDLLPVRTVHTQSELRNLAIKLFDGDADAALFYFSGHGHINQFGGYLLTPDAQKYNEGLPMQDVLHLANTSRIKNKIIILDCCNAGSMGYSNGSSGTIQAINDGITIITSSREDEESVEIHGHGLFTSLLLDALRGGAADILGNITPGSIYTYIDKALGSWAQRPVFRSNVSHFISVRNIQPLISKAVLKRIIEYFPSPDYEFVLDPSYEYTNTNIAKPENVTIFKHLQKMEGVGLVVPVGEEHMYFAAQNSKSCRLTSIGHSYWRLVKERKV